MLNHVVLIGRIHQMPQEQRSEEGVKKFSFILEVERPFKESDGSYQYDYFTITPWRGIAEQMMDICAENEIIGVKGRLCSYNMEQENVSGFEVIAEKITFLSTRKQEG